ncbi:DEAD/DEAH box helicase [Robertmurraya korlensis]|uniref:DEAD/DEAH box helicase n=1 Tax=Robertmurraya korlensis TaxID=519977 RepID=UPI00082650C6|nr:AAA domain-containing protein [Robertmurraya korlensis]
MAAYLQVWQKAIQMEIAYLKKYGSTKYRLIHGYAINEKEPYIYYFNTASTTTSIPIGSKVTLWWGERKIAGRVLSSEGKSIMVEVEQYMGAVLSELMLQYDPWELLDELINRLQEIRSSKKKRARIHKMMDPSMLSRHPLEKIKSNVHELVLRSKYNPITFVWGPPGTGKTYTLARVVANKYLKGKKVLVLSQSNQAVDVLMLEILRFVSKQNKLQVGELLRYGSQVSEVLQDTPLTIDYLLKRNHPELSEQREEIRNERHLLKKDLTGSFTTRDSQALLEVEKKLGQIIDKIRSKEIAFVKDAEVIGTTLAKAATDPSIYEKEYDLVILDEVSMAYIPQVAFAVSLGKKSIVCGDFKQLPPIAHSKHPLVNEWLKEDVFHKSGVVRGLDEGILHPHLFLLSEQRRMHPEISAFTNRFVYMGLVKDYESMYRVREPIANRAPFPKMASILLDTSHMGEYCMRSTTGSRFNILQLLLSFQVIHELYQGGSRDIGYTTPYRAQAELMGILLQDLYNQQLGNGEIFAATVHKFQGSEREVMVFDTVDSLPEARPSMLLTGKESERLINVAVTRTKGKFVHIVNRTYINQKVYRDKTIRRLVEFQEQMNQVVTPGQIGTWIKNQHTDVSWMHAKKLEKVMSDVISAKTEIIVSLPEGKQLSNEWNRFLQRSNVKYKHLKKENQPPFPIVMVDQKILWIGVPYEAVSGTLPPYVSVRVSSEALCTYFLSQLENI